MTRFFFSRDDSGRNEWWWYVLTLLLVFTGTLGFGSLPWQFALQSKGITGPEFLALSQPEKAAFFTHNQQLAFNLFQFVAGAAMLLLAFRFIHHKRVLPFFTTRGAFDIKRFFAGFLVWGAVLGILFAIGYTEAVNSGTLKWNYNAGAFFSLLTICVFLVPLQTGCEELLCRGYILKWTGRATSRGIAIVLINGIIFGGLHCMNPEVQALGWYAMLFYIVSGFFTAFIVVMDDGIELSWGFHTANNVMNLLIVSTTWQAMPTDSLFVDVSKPEAGPELLIVLFVCYPLMALLFAKMYRWKNWRERLLGPGK